MLQSWGYKELDTTWQEQYIRQTVNKDLLYDTANSTPYSIITYWEKNLKKNEYMYN